MRPLVATVLVVTSGVLPVFLTGAVAVQMRSDLGLSETLLGVAFACFYLVSACCSAVFGGVAERLGAANSMRLSAIGSAAVLIGIAVAAPSAGSLFAWLMAGGVVNALTQPASNLFISRTIPVDRLGIGFAIKQSAVPGGVLLGGLAVPMVALTVGWRWAFICGGVLALFGAILTGSSAGVDGRQPGGARRDQPNKALFVLGAGIGFGAAAAAGLGSFLTSSAEQVGFGEGAAGWFAVGGSVGVIVTRLVLGSWSDRLGRFGRHEFFAVVAAMLGLGAAGWMLMATMRPAPLVVGGLLAFSAGWGWPGLFNLSIARANPNAPAAASGVTQSGTYAGAGLGPVAFGMLADRFSYSAAWAFAAAVATCAALLMLAGRRLLVPVG